ncbi:MAG: glucose-6-phosphate isomerase [Pseudomonadota bacterium]
MTDWKLTAAWGAVDAAAARLRQRSLRDLFADDPRRFETLSYRLDDLLIDLSKEKIDAAALSALVDLAEAAGVTARRDAMVAGEAINETEGRAVLHMALRGGAGPSVLVEGHDIMPDVTEVLNRFLAFAEDVRTGRFAPAGGGRFTDVVNIGIGGSDLGPAMAVRALRPDHDGPRLHFVSNVDGAHLTDTLAGLDASTTLVIIASKTFTTQETMTNARSIADWQRAQGVIDPGAHMAALSTNLEATGAFGIDPSRVFGFWDWVGGRYSVWGAIGLPLAIAIDADGFRAFLDGARAMDEHFRGAPLAENLPALLALTGIWRRNAMGWPTVALIPYDQRLEFFAAYVQQLDMESNGKRTTLGGAPPRGVTGPVIWGEPGTNAQHSFFQHLHQGTDTIPVDFIAACTAREDLGDHHGLLLANCLAQGRALAFGRTEAEAKAAMSAAGMDADEVARLAPHRSFPGDRPSTTILHQQLTPYALGRLIALFEHKVFVQGVIWGVNSFDQWGVELGKVLAGELVPVMIGEAAAEGFDASTMGLIAHIKGE